MQPKSLHAFTLVELLVVVTIIVLLLALLAPAVDQAIYQAEMATCAARLDGIAAGANIYAITYKRSYPDRSAGLATGDYRPTRVAHPTAKENLMRMVEGFIPVELMLDPLSPEIELDRESQPAPGTVYVDANYSFYFGWRFPQAGGSGGMNKMGGSFGWNATQSNGKKRQTEFKVIAAGQEYIDVANIVLTAHPDKDGKLSAEVVQNSLSPGHTVLLQTPNGQYTASYYFGSQGRGLVDMNFAYVDGSVRRIDDLKGHVTPDEGMARVPVGNGGGDTVHLPIR